MNSTTLNTAAEILEAFRACNNAGEEIDLFESLATRPDPPVTAFVEILKEVKLEAILALSIQAFGKITDADVKERLKQSSDLLTLLSEQAQSGKTDLIRWSAATTIEKLGFDFIAVSRHLAEEPKKIAEKIMQSKIKRLADKNLTQSNDYDEYLRFWTYGNYNKLREVTLELDYTVLNLHWTKYQKENDSKDEAFNKYDVCYKVINSLALKGVKEINAALERAIHVMDDTSHLDENEVFEGIGNAFASKYAKNEDYYLNNLLLCLQSNNYVTRFKAANNILNNYPDVQNKLKENNQILYLAVIIFSKQYKNVYYSFDELVNLSNKLLILSDNLWRKKVKEDCLIWRNNILTEIQKIEQERKQAFETRKQAFEARENFSSKLNLNLDTKLRDIKYTNSLVYDQVISRHNFAPFPQISVEEDGYNSIFDNYDKSLKEEASRLRGEVSKFYEGYKQSELATLDAKIKKAETTHNQVSKLLKFEFRIGFLVAPLFLIVVLVIFMQWDLAITRAIFGTAFFAFPVCYLLFLIIISNKEKYTSKELNEAKNKYSDMEFLLKNEEQKILILLMII